MFPNNSPVSQPQSYSYYNPIYGPYTISSQGGGQQTFSPNGWFPGTSWGFNQPMHFPPPYFGMFGPPLVGQSSIALAQQSPNDVNQNKIRVGDGSAQEEAHESSRVPADSVAVTRQGNQQNSAVQITAGLRRIEPKIHNLNYPAHIPNQQSIRAEVPPLMTMANTVRKGSFQELMLQVSKGRFNQPEVHVPNTCELTATKCLNESSGNQTVEETDVEDDGDDVECDGGDEYHDADDEETEEAMSEERERERVANIDVCAEVSEEAASYEFVLVNKDGHAVNKQRRRFPKGYKIPDCREPRDIGTIEKAMRNASKRGEGRIFEPKLGMVFDSRAEAYKFFNLYSWQVGFGIRFGSFAKNRVNQMRTMQETVCEKEGFDRRCKDSSKRIRCKAMIRLHRTEDMGWYVSRHIAQYNHPVSVSCAEKREWRSHSKIEDCTRQMIWYLRESNISLNRVHCFMGNVYGGMKSVPFNPRSIRAVCSQLAREQKHDDLSKTLEVFRKLREKDPGFQFSVDHDADKKVKSLIWTSGRGRSQYNFFGDAITFDTTYCTNIYKMPFGMFVGVNNHFQSIIFAGVLVTKEDTESFIWVFKEFLVLMGGKLPVTILTDQCKAMTKAIKLVFTAGTLHLWCKWHVLRHAPEELGPVYTKDTEFQIDFHYVISQMLTIDEFERAWDILLETYNLRENEFMKRTFEKRHKWAKPWARDIFCARMASTQRSESANSLLKTVAPRNSSMNKFVEHFDKFLFLRTLAEEKEEHATKQFVHRTKRMYPLEKHAIKVYTRNCFKLFSEEVDKATDYEVELTEDENVFLVVHINKETRMRWARVVFKVELEDNGQKYLCECGQYTHFGILCCHAIKVMMYRKVHKIPECHIMKRWTRDARDYEYAKNTDDEVGEQLAESLLFANALDVVSMTKKGRKAGEILTRHLKQARKEIEEMDADTGKNFLASSGSEGYDEDYSTDQSGYTSNAQGAGMNVYGASGSSAYMSDAEIRQMKPPIAPVVIGRKRQNRHLRLFERKRTSRKKYTGSPAMFQNCLDEDDENNEYISQVASQENKQKKKETKKQGKRKKFD